MPDVERDVSDMADDEHELTAELRKLGRIHARAAGESPPASVDATILARSRAAVRASSRGRRWWIPASVAATALIAVSLVTRIQHESSTGLPENSVVTAGQPSPEAVSAAPAATLMQDTASPAAADAAAAAAEDAPPPRVDPEAEKRGMPSRQAMPRMKSRPEAPPTSAQPDTDVALVGMATIEESSPDEVAAARSATTPAATAARTAERAATPVTPEAWLEKIEALETAGRLEEAARERALLEEAYPGWLAAHPALH
jgi:hypothetical protein